MKVTFYTAWGKPCGIRDYSANLIHFLSRYIECQIVPAPEPMPSWWASRRVFAQLGRAMNAGDVAHLQHSFEFWGGASSARNRFPDFRRQIHVPVVMTVHDLYAGWERAQPPPSAQWRKRAYAALRRVAYRALSDEQNYLRRLNVETFDAADRLIAHHRYHQKILEARGISPAKIALIPHGVPLHQVVPGDATASRQKWNLQGKRVLTIFGFITPQKGMPLALEALVHLPEDSVLVIAGGAREAAGAEHLVQLRQIIAEKEMGARAQITGYLAAEEIANLMAATDVVLAPFQAMTGSGSLAMALAYGKPIVASDLPPNREINESLPCLQLFKAGDVEELVQKIQCLLDAPELRRQLSSQALAYAQENSFERVAQTTIALYQSLR
jgi:glycosyltransferase involved in cell wall biosynthesis